MVKAVIDRGAIRLLEPLPADWGEGRTVMVDAFDDGDASDLEIQADFAKLDLLCSMNDPADEERLERALADVERDSKELMRKEMRLP
jgi:hypothetical protein